MKRDTNILRVMIHENLMDKYSGFMVTNFNGVFLLK